ncbi:hypothetical protein [Tritonibacter litoralis]|uniref:hypothetical protein n=1 Tax=Tritonibacter litoralis TaxID=2662264 RepID=UPI001885930F|nr:hypothetical protein [Tritonibacter litoralis]
MGTTGPKGPFDRKVYAAAQLSEADISSSTLLILAVEETLVGCDKSDLFLLFSLITI